jgi:hypothetical protein
MENAKPGGLGVFSAAAKGAYDQLVALHRVLNNPGPRGVDVDKAKALVKLAMGHADTAKRLAEREGGLENLLGDQANGLNVHIHMHVKD